MHNIKMESKIGIAFLLVLCTYQAYAEVSCTSEGPGRHAEPTDTTCRNYTYCVYDRSTLTYLSYNYTCPTSSVFNPNTAQCTAAGNYVCTNTNTATTVCTADGFVADPASTDCSTYIECVQIGTTFTETIYPCPDGTFFDPSTTLCDPDYNCITSSTSTCTAAGRFANTADITCQTYFNCVLAGNGTYVQYNYTCPTSSVFSPTTRLCTTSYTCPTRLWRSIAQ